MKRTSLPLPRPRPPSDEEEDPINMSRDDSEDFAIEADTAFFQPTASDEILSPVVPSPTAFGPGRVYSAHSLYGEDLVQSSRPLSAGNNTISTAEDEDRIMGPQQPFIPEEEGTNIFEDLLVSPSSPVSEAPTTPPSVAPRPSLSPPPLILPGEPALSTLPPTTTAVASGASQHPETTSSRTPLRPPRAPGNQPRHSSSTPVNNNKNHRRNGSDSSFMSALTDASFGSVQTAPPPPRTLPLPLLSSSSSWTRYTNGVTAHQLPVLDNNVKGMNISVPSKLQQPVLMDDEPLPANDSAPGNGTTSPNNKMSLPRHVTPPRHRPPQGRGVASKNSGRTVVSLQQYGLASTKSGPSLTKSSQPQNQQSHQKEKRDILDPDTLKGHRSTFQPIPQRTRSYSSDATGARQSSPVTTKPRSYSSDLILPTNEPVIIASYSIPEMSFLDDWKPSQTDQSCDADTQTSDSFRLQEWFAQAYSPMESPTSSGTSAFGRALLMLGTRSTGRSGRFVAENPPLRKIQSATSTITEVSKLSTISSPEPSNVETKTPLLERDAFDLYTWAAIVGVFAILGGHAIVQGSLDNMLLTSLLVGLAHAALFALSCVSSVYLWRLCGPKLGAWFAHLSDEAFLRLLLARGWPSSLILCGVLETTVFTGLGCTYHSLFNQFGVIWRLSLVSVVLGTSETIRRYVVGNLLQASLYHRLGSKLQRLLKRICAVRYMACYSGSVQVKTLYSLQPRGSNVTVEEMLAFERTYACLRSDRALSFEYGLVGTKKERSVAANNLYDAMAVQGVVRLATLQEAAKGNETISSVIREMFPCGSTGIVSHGDFCTAIDSLNRKVSTLLKMLHDEYVLQFSFTLVEPLLPHLR